MTSCRRLAAVAKSRSWQASHLVVLGNRQTSVADSREYPVLNPPHHIAGPSGERLSPERDLLLPKVWRAVTQEVGVVSVSSAAVATALFRPETSSENSKRPCFAGYGLLVDAH